MESQGIVRMKNTLNPYFSNRNSNYEFKPTDKVFVPTLDTKFGDGTIKIIGSSAYRNLEDAKLDRLGVNPKGVIKDMTVKEFLKKRLNKYNSTNEYYRLKEFAEKYEEKYGIIIGAMNE
jgi:hypothetical protein